MVMWAPTETSHFKTNATIVRPISIPSRNGIIGICQTIWSRISRCVLVCSRLFWQGWPTKWTVIMAYSWWVANGLGWIQNCLTQNTIQFILHRVKRVGSTFTCDLEKDRHIMHKYQSYLKFSCHYKLIFLDNIMVFLESDKDHNNIGKIK